MLRVVSFDVPMFYWLIRCLMKTGQHDLACNTKHTGCFKAEIKNVSGDIHQLQLIKVHNFKLKNV